MINGAVYSSKINRDAIDAMKSAWPCHGLPDELDGITFAIADNGDLVDLDCYDVDDHPVEIHPDSELVILALIEGEQAKLQLKRLNQRLSTLAYQLDIA